MSIKANHVCGADQLLEGGFMAKFGSLRPKLSLLYLKAKINKKNLSSLGNALLRDPKARKKIGLANA